MLAEDIEEIDSIQLEAIRSTGTRWMKTVAFAVWPQIRHQLNRGNRPLPGRSGKRNRGPPPADTTNWYSAPGHARLRRYLYVSLGYQYSRIHGFRTCRSGWNRPATPGLNKHSGLEAGFNDSSLGSRYRLGKRMGYRDSTKTPTLK